MGKEHHVYSSDEESKWKKEFKKWGWRLGLVGVALLGIAALI